MSVVSDIYYLESSVDTLGVSITIDQGQFLLISFYKHPEFRICTEHWNNLFASTANFNTVAILGDFNAHSILRGYAHTFPAEL